MRESDIMLPSLGPAAAGPTCSACISERARSCRRNVVSRPGVALSSASTITSLLFYFIKCMLCVKVVHGRSSSRTSSATLSRGRAEFSWAWWTRGPCGRSASSCGTSPHGWRGATSVSVLGSRLRLWRLLPPRAGRGGEGGGGGPRGGGRPAVGGGRARRGFALVRQHHLGPRNPLRVKAPPR
jgi:hypothetical protein